MADALTLLAVFPHPDDESLGMGGTLAKYSAEGVRAHLLCATRGERGWGGPEAENPGLAALGRIREAELRCAVGQLGLSGLHLLNYIDGDVDQAEPGAIIAQVAGHVRRVRPQVVVTFSPDGAYGHPDHIALAQFTAAALVCAADPSFPDPDHLAAFRVQKFYYMADSKSLVEAFRQAVGPISMEIDGVERAHFGWEEWAITTRIDTSQYADTTWRAILCHQSQLVGYGPLLTMPRESVANLLAEGTFVRVFSLVNGGRAVERDLFEGLRPHG